MAVARGISERERVRALICLYGLTLIRTNRRACAPTLRGTYVRVYMYGARMYKALSHGWCELDALHIRAVCVCRGRRFASRDFRSLAATVARVSFWIL